LSGAGLQTLSQSATSGAHPHDLAFICYHIAAASLEAILRQVKARIVLATGRLVGEGFDHAPLNTLLLAMPVSWKGTLQQYAGRLHRQQSGKTSVRIIDWLDLGHPITQRMWERRRRGYRAMGYALLADQLSMTGA
jgi:superfamily II DNA or RNA helicase